MTRSFAAAIAVLVAVSCATAVRAASNTDPPLGIVPTTMKLATMIALHKKAVGQPASPQPSTSETWLYTQGSFGGTIVRVASGDDYREDVTLGPFHTASGAYRGTSWEQNANGIVVRVTGIHRRDEIDRAAFARALTTDSGVTLLGEDAAENSYVVKVAPAGGRVEYLFFDKDSHLLVRSERAIEDQRVVTSYDDFRTTNGETTAWHRTATDGRPFNDESYQLQTLDYLKSVDPSRLQIPSSDTSHLKLASAKVDLPGQILSDRIILTAQINGRAVDFQLDSGASEILLNKAVADALKLPSYGKQTETTAGTYTTTRSIVPRIDFGGATLENVAVTTAAFHTWADDATPVAGLLGFDFIAGCVIRIDYVHGRVQAIDPATFDPPVAAIELPIRLDDDVPVVGLKIGATTSDRFILDTGADRSTLFSSFVLAHPQDAADQGLGQQFTEAYPFFDRVAGVGGTIRVTRTQVPSLVVGSASFPRWLFSVVHDAAAFEGEDYDGLLGQDILRNFDVYLDYPQLKIYLVPNDRYRERWGS